MNLLQAEGLKKPLPGPRRTSHGSLSFVDLQKYDLNKENDRSRTFLENGCEIENVKNFAIIGYYLVERPNVVKCQFCSVVQIASEIINSEISHHLRVSPNCPLLKRRSTLNQPISAAELDQILPPASYDVCGTGSIDETSQSYDVPASSRRRSRIVSRSELDIKYPEYKLHCDRVKTFDKWPRGIKQKPDDLAEAGFFYSGKGDEIVCFSCGLGMCQLEPDDNLWVEHKRLLIHSCYYLELNREILNSNQIKYNEYMNSKDSKNVVLEHHNQLENEATSSSSSIETLCKICLDRKVNIVFLPCKHAAVCSQCVFGIDEKCPICREKITDKINLFFS